MHFVSSWLSGRWWWYTLVQYLQYGRNVTLALYNLSLVTPYCHTFKNLQSGVIIVLWHTDKKGSTQVTAKRTA